MIKILYNGIMNIEKPKNVTEFSEQELVKAPVIDVEKFQDGLNDADTKSEESENYEITWKEMKALKKSRYFQVKDKYNTSFVLKNKRNGIIAEIQASTPIQACHFIGWKANQVKVMETFER